MSLKSRFWLCVLAVAGLALWLVWPVMTPFLAGMLVAFLLDPMADRLEERGVSRGAAAGLVIGAFFVAAVAILVALVPFVWSQVADLIASLPVLEPKALEMLRPYWETLKPHLDQDTLAKAQEVATSSLGTVANTMGSLARGALASGVAVVDVLSLAIVTPVVAYYLLKDWDHLVAWIDGHLPRREAPFIRAQAARINGTLAAWLRGQATMCLVLAFYYATALSVAGLKYSLLIGIITGLCAFIPFVGFGIGLCAAVLAGLTSFTGWIGWAAIAAVFTIGQILEGYVLTPKLVGRSVGLNEVWVMFALMACGHLMGFVGVLLAVPMAAVVRVLGTAAVAGYRASRFFADCPTAPVAEVAAEADPQRPAA